MRGILESLWRKLVTVLTATASGTEVSPAQFKQILKRYYDSNEVYTGLSDNAPKGLRNPARRAVEFYPAHLFPGRLEDALPIEAENTRLAPAIMRIWKWSSWAQRKQVLARHLALYGDAFIKVASQKAEPGQNGGPDKEARVWEELLDPRYVTEFVKDGTGQITFLRIDKPQAANKQFDKPHTKTEIWRAENGTYKGYRHTQAIGALEGTLGGAVESANISELGTNRIPVVHAAFQDPGDETNGGRGVGVFAPFLDLIDEHNSMVTRGHDIFFRYDKPIWALRANGVDKDQRPIPAPQIGRISTAPGPGAEDENAAEAQERETLTLQRDVFLSLPGNSTIESMVPQVDFSAGLAWEKAMGAELAENLPELLYSQLKDKGELSGRALRLIMAPAIDRAVEARGNAEAAIVEANIIALQVGQALNLEGFGAGDIGQFDAPEPANNFDHSFRERDVLQVSELEALETDRIRLEVIELKQRLGLITPEEARAEAGAEPNPDAVPSESVEGDQPPPPAATENAPSGGGTTGAVTAGARTTGGTGTTAPRPVAPPPAGGAAV